MAQPQLPPTKNWRFELDFEGIGWLTIDTPKAAVNTLSREAIAELETLVLRFEDLVAEGSLQGVVLLSAKDTGFIAGADGAGQGSHVLGADIGLFVQPDADGVEHGGDARGGDLGVMRLHRGHRVPAHLGARRIMDLEVVGMQFDKARDQVIPVQIGAGAGGGADIGDDAAIDAHRALQHFIGQYDPGIGKDEIPEGDTVHGRVISAFIYRHHAPLR